MIKGTIDGCHKNGKRQKSADSIQEYPSITVELNNIDRESELSEQLKAVTNLVRKINERQANLESKISNIEAKLNE